MKVKLFLDGAESEAMKKAAKDPKVSGFTTNPTLMKKAGITDYAGFAKEMIKAIPDKSISFEVFSDDLPSMEKEARIIHSWGGNTYVKIPITNTKRESTVPLIQKLSHEGYSLNITAIFTMEQVKAVAKAVSPKSRTIVSVFAGRIADTGVDPEPLMKESAAVLKSNANAELLWASSRELLNVFQAERTGCHIITATGDILSKMALVGKSLDDYSLETVQMFYKDAQAAGFKLF